MSDALTPAELVIVRAEALRQRFTRQGIDRVVAWSAMPEAWTFTAELNGLFEALGNFDAGAKDETP